MKFLKDLFSKYIGVKYNMKSWPRQEAHSVNRQSIFLLAGTVTVYPLSDDKKAHGSLQFQMHFYTSPPIMPFSSFQYINSGTKGKASENGYVSLGWILGYTQLAGEIHAEWWPQTPSPPVKSHVKVYGTELLGHRQCPSATGICMIGTLD